MMMKARDKLVVDERIQAQTQCSVLYICLSCSINYHSIVLQSSSEDEDVNFIVIDALLSCLIRLSLLNFDEVNTK